MIYIEDLYLWVIVKLLRISEWSLSFISVFIFKCSRFDGILGFMISFFFVVNELFWINCILCVVVSNLGFFGKCLFFLFRV